MNRIVWIVSYPKSGNTWIRILLSNYLADTGHEASINDLATRGHAASRELFDRATQLQAAQLTPKEILRRRPQVYEWLARHQQSRAFIKVHDAFAQVGPDHPLFPAQATQAAIHIVRHPGDVALSWAHHYGLALDDALQTLRTPTTLADSKFGLSEQLPQHIATWGDHARSWRAAARLFPVLTLRYEDLHNDCARQFGKIVRFIGLPECDARLQRALQYSSLERLQAQEARVGFRESLSAGRAFFRSGRVGAWRRQLTSQQISQLESDHGSTMSEFGYGLESKMALQSV